MLGRVKKLDLVTKIGLLILVMMVVYILFLFLLKPVFIPEIAQLPHTTVMGDHIMTFTSPEQRNLNFAAIFLAIAVGIGLWLLVKESPPVQKDQVKEKQDELEIVKRALSPDEKKILEEIQKAEEITQDSLRFRLNWSKAKVSAILLQLDRMNLVQRERQGKTYNVFLAKKKKE